MTESNEFAQRRLKRGIMTSSTQRLEKIRKTLASIYNAYRKCKAKTQGEAKIQIFFLGNGRSPSNISALSVNGRFATSSSVNSERFSLTML